MLLYAGLNASPRLITNTKNSTVCDEFTKLADDVTELTIAWNYFLVWKNQDLFVCGNFGAGDEERKLVVPGEDCHQIVSALPTKEFVIILTNDCKIWQYRIYEDTWTRLDSFIPSNDDNLQEFITKMENNSCIVALTNLGRLFNVPHLVDMPKRVKFVDIACGFDHTIMLTEDGDVYSMGMGTRGQLGHGDLEDCDDAKLIEALAGLKISQIAAGGWHSAALTNNGDLYSWGWNTTGELGFITDQKVVAVPTVVDFKNKDEKVEDVVIKKVQCGNNFTVCLSDDGILWGCGSNKYGQLGQPREDLMNAKTFVKLKINCDEKNVTDIYCREWGSIVTIK